MPDVSKPNILLALTKARDIDQVSLAMDEILKTRKYDVFRTNYYNVNDSRYTIRQKFLEDPNFQHYTHLAIWPDDLLVTLQDIETLESHLDKYKVVCGCCNIDILKEHEGLINISAYRVDVNRKNRRYIWLDESGKDHLYNSLRAQKQPVQVGFAGDPLFVFARDVVEKLSFESDAKYNDFSPDAGCCNDVVANYEIQEELGIPVMCDLSVRMKHLKISDTVSPAPVLVGIKPAFCEYFRAKELSLIHYVKY